MQLYQTEPENLQKREHINRLDIQLTYNTLLSIQREKGTVNKNSPWYHDGAHREVAEQA